MIGPGDWREKAGVLAFAALILLVVGIMLSDPARMVWRAVVG